MTNSEIESVLAEYLNNPKAEYAVMINGEWGSGKTFFLTHSLMGIIETIDDGKAKRRKCAYVSLYGASSIDEVSKAIVFQYFGRKNKKKTEVADAVLETASNIITASLGAFNIDLSKAKETLPKININDWIVCFDDLERCCLPINEVLGYINRLVEHNKCKVIILANESEIGKIALNQRLEEKYQVILSGRRLSVNDEIKESGQAKEPGISIPCLQKEVKKLFNEDILYQTIREKVIGLTIKYEPQMDVIFDSLIADYPKKFKKYLQKNKKDVLDYFSDQACCNLRTLISSLGSVKKVYDEMLCRKMDSIEHFDEIMKEFLEYIVKFTIYYRNGGKVQDIGLTAQMGYIQFNQKHYDRVRGFKFLEYYCTTLSFAEKEFERVVSVLRQEYKEKDDQEKKYKSKNGDAYIQLNDWFMLEDEEVKELITQLREEVEQDKYFFSHYQGIIGQLLFLKHYNFDIGDMDALIKAMNSNIENSKETLNIERQSFSFEGEPDLEKQYDEYVDNLTLKVETVNQIIKSSEVERLLESKNWAKELFSYCDEHYDDFISRYGFIDLLDINSVLEKLDKASPKEIYAIRDVFKKVYKISNINEFFKNDTEKIKEFRNALANKTPDGIYKPDEINRPLARKVLTEYLDDIINRLER